MNYQQYQMNHATRERFQFLFGIDGQWWYCKYQQIGTIAALCEAEPEAKQQIDVDMRVLARQESQ